MHSQRRPTANEVAVHAATVAVKELTRKGRHGVRLFSSQENFIYFAAVTIFIFLPLSFILAVMPFWDWVGQSSVMRFAEHLIAPSIETVPFEYRARGFPSFPIRRFTV
jgi:hypothetical protein